MRLRQQNVNMQLPPAFDAWLLECIQRDPARRFASAGAAMDALAQAYGKSPRARCRADSKPAGGLPFASADGITPTPAATAPAAPKVRAASAPAPSVMAAPRAPAPARAGEKAARSSDAYKMR